MKLRLLSLSLLVGMLLAISSSAAAQSNYSFSLDQETVSVYLNSDGMEAVDYVFAFTNSPGAHIIDFVDVGMPNGDFDINSISADVGGSSVSISSNYQGSGSYGFSVDMGDSAIQPGSSGSVHVHVGSISNVLYQDTQTSTDASADFSPTWFDSSYVLGNTNLTMNFYFPPGLTPNSQPNEPRYHDPQGGWPGNTAPAMSFDSTQNRIVYTWQNSEASGSTQYTFGVSFPKQYVPSGAIVVPPPFDLGGFIAGLGGNLTPICCGGFFLLMFVGAPILGAVNQSKRKFQYLPPKIQIEGHGIKRGLTAVEAAILMEEPLEKVMTMILFGVVKKNAATVVSKDPLKLQLASPQPADLHDYEKDFLNAFTGDDLFRRKNLQDMTIKLVNSVSDKMKGFSRKETVDYYKGIMERAWQQIETAGTPEVKSQMYDESLEWTMLDKNYDQRTQRAFPVPILLPIWWGRYDPGFHPSTAPTTGAAKVGVPSSSAGRSALPGSALAASMVGSVQGFSSKVVGDMKSFTSGVTTKTNPVPVSTASHGSWSGGGGHSCACACACAGCACACAGGGR